MQSVGSTVGSHSIFVLFVCWLVCFLQSFVRIPISLYSTNSYLNTKGMIIVIILVINVVRFGYSLEAVFHISNSCVEGLWSNAFNPFNPSLPTFVTVLSCFCHSDAVHSLWPNIFFHIFLCDCCWRTYNNKVVIFYLAITSIRRCVGVYIRFVEWRIFYAWRCFFSHLDRDEMQTTAANIQSLDWVNLRLTIFWQPNKIVMKGSLPCVFVYAYFIFFARDLFCYVFIILFVYKHVLKASYRHNRSVWCAFLRFTSYLLYKSILIFGIFYFDLHKIIMIKW